MVIETRIFFFITLLFYNYHNPIKISVEFPLIFDNLKNRHQYNNAQIKFNHVILT